MMIIIEDILLGGPSCPLYPGRIGIQSVGFCEGRKTKGVGEKPPQSGPEPTTNSTLVRAHVASGSGSEPGPQQREAGALTTASSPLPVGGSAISLRQFNLRITFFLVLQHNVKRSKAKAMKHYKAHTRRSYVY